MPGCIEGMKDGHLHWSKTKSHPRDIPSLSREGRGISALMSDSIESWKRGHSPFAIGREHWEGGGFCHSAVFATCGLKAIHRLFSIEPWLADEKWVWWMFLGVKAAGNVSVSTAPMSRG